MVFPPLWCGVMTSIFFQRFILVLNKIQSRQIAIMIWMDQSYPTIEKGSITYGKFCTDPLTCLKNFHSFLRQHKNNELKSAEWKTWIKTKLDLSDKEFPEQRIFYILFFNWAVLVRYFMSPFLSQNLKFIIGYRMETWCCLTAMYKLPSTPLPVTWREHLGTLKGMLRISLSTVGTQVNQRARTPSVWRTQEWKST